MASIEPMICGGVVDERTMQACQKLLAVLERVRPHYENEKDVIYPYVEKMIAKGTMEGLVMEHDKLERMSLVMGATIEDLLENKVTDMLKAVKKEELAVKSAAEYACQTIKLLKTHFQSEEKHLFPVLGKLTEKQVETVLSKWGKH